MRLSKNAEKLLLLLYRKDKGEDVKVSSDTMKMPTDSLAKVWEELERKNEENILYAENLASSEMGLPDITGIGVNKFKISEDGKKYVNEYLI